MIDYGKEDPGLFALWLAGYTTKGLGKARADRTGMSDEFERGEVEYAIREEVKRRLKRKGKVKP